MIEEVLEVVNLEEFLDLNYDLDLIKRIENNEPISKSEYLYYEYCMPTKLISLNMILKKIERDKNNGS